MTPPSTYAVRHPAAWELALKAAAEEPGIHQAELADRLRESTGLAPTTAINLLRSMEREGALAGVRVGRRKGYQASANGNVASNGHRPSNRGRRSSGAAGAPAYAAWRQGNGRTLAMLASGVVLMAASVSVFAAPGKPTDSSGDDGASRAASGTEAPSAQTATPARRAASGQRPSKPSRPAPAGIDPSKVDVAVLSGVGVPGIAARTGEELRRMRFDVGTVANAAQPLGSSVVLYGPGAADEARTVARRLEIARREPLDAANRALAGGSSVVVVLGGDRAE